MIAHWFIRNGLRLWVVMSLLLLVAMIARWLAPVRPLVYYVLQMSRQAPKVVVLDIDRFIPVYFNPQPPLPGAAISQWALSPDGRYLAFQNGFDLMRMDWRGGHQQWLTSGGLNHLPVWSPDSTQIAFISERDNNQEIYVMDADGGNERRLTVNDLYDNNPVWSPDGKRIVFTTSYGGQSDISVVDSDGSNLLRLTTSEMIDTAQSWSPVSQHIVFASHRDGDSDIYVMDADGQHQRPLTENNASDQNPSWSPDGQHIVFASNRPGGKLSIFVMDADGSNQRLLVSTVGNGNQPVWSRDGQFITFYDVVGTAGSSYVVDADGRNLRLLTTWNQPLITPLWVQQP